MSYFSQESERLIFRKLTEEDVPLWSVFFKDNPAIRFVAFDKLELTEMEKSAKWINMQISRYEEPGMGQLAVIEKESGDFIGVGGIIIRELDNKREYEITYSLIPKYWYKGYATELAIHFKNYALSKLDCTSVISIIAVENEASKNVARKNGMKQATQIEFMGMQVYIFRTT